jgi:hypothetical protein
VCRERTVKSATSNAAADARATGAQLPAISGISFRGPIRPNEMCASPISSDISKGLLVVIEHVKRTQTKIKLEPLVAAIAILHSVQIAILQ